MKDLMEIASECMVMLDDLGIEYGNVVDWSVNTRAKNRWGQCRKLPNGNFTINISSRLLEDDISFDSVADTVLHELIHTVDGCFNHGEQWQRIAHKVNVVYGYNIKRCSTADEKGVEEIYSAPKPIKHQFRCVCCGKVYSRTRDSKFTKNYENYRCGVCGGEFEKLL